MDHLSRGSVDAHDQENQVIENQECTFGESEKQPQKWIRFTHFVTNNFHLMSNQWEAVSFSPINNDIEFCGFGLFSNFDGKNDVKIEFKWVHDI